MSNTSLISAYKIGEKTKKLDFDWSTSQEVLQKVDEELQELEQEISNESESNLISEEYGDLLFSMVQLGRHLNINPEHSLRQANQKFINRFTAMEKMALKKNCSFNDYSRKEKEDAWTSVKMGEKK